MTAVADMLPIGTLSIGALSTDMFSAGTLLLCAVFAVLAAVGTWATRCLLYTSRCV